MVGLRNKYPVLNTLVSVVESSKEEGNSVSKTHSSTEPISPLQNTKVYVLSNQLYTVRYFCNRNMSGKTSSINILHIKLCK